MISCRHINKIVAVITALAVIACLTIMIFAESISEAKGVDRVPMEYETELFDTASTISVNIIMDEDDWNDMLVNAISEEYYMCDVEINGTIFYSVGIRPKGNTSLSSIVSDDTTDRYSFKIEFGQYIKGQTCWGLDKLVLNNNFADATNMKEAIVYDMYQFLGADASLYNYARISVNDEYWGVYLALEAVEDSFLLRNYGVDYGDLYKPDSMNFGGAGGMGQFGAEDINDMMNQFFGQSGDSTGNGGATVTLPDGTSVTLPDGFTVPGAGSSSSGATFPGGGMTWPGSSGTSAETNADGSAAAPSRDNSNFDFNKAGFNNDFGGFSMSGNGADLNYIDDDTDSYSTIWNGEVSSTSDSDHKRVVEALKNISERNGLEKYMNIDNILKYMAVHEFSVNMDSLSGTMDHNYYLYEKNGQLNIIPWDYNLSWGGFSQGGSNGGGDIVNHPIDSPYSDKDFFDALLENEEYAARYHEYLQQLVDEYYYGGRFGEVYNRIRSQIDESVKTDPTAFYTYDEYNKGAETLYELIMLRAESIKGQLDGTIPSTKEGQAADSSTLIDASSINVSVMGSMSNGGGAGGAADRGTKGPSKNSGTGSGGVTYPGTVPSDAAETTSATDASGSDRVVSNLNYSGSASAVVLSFSAPAANYGAGVPVTGNAPGGGNFPGGGFPGPGMTGNETGSETGDSSMPGGGSFMPGMSGDISKIPGFSGNTAMPDRNNVNKINVETAILYAVCLIIMIAGLLFAKHFRRNPYR